MPSHTNPFMLMNVSIPSLRAERCSGDFRHMHDGDRHGNKDSPRQYPPLQERVLLNTIEAILIRYVISSASLHQKLRGEELYTRFQAVRDPLRNSLIHGFSRADFYNFIAENTERFELKGHGFIGLSPYHDLRELPDICKIERMLLEAGHCLQIQDIRQAECLWGETFFTSVVSDGDISNLLKRHPDRFLMMSDDMFDLSESIHIPHPVTTENKQSDNAVLASKEVSSENKEQVSRFASLDYNDVNTDLDGIQPDLRFATLDIDALQESSDDVDSDVIQNLERIFSLCMKTVAFQNAEDYEKLFLLLSHFQEPVDDRTLTRFFCEKLNISGPQLMVLFQKHEELFSSLTCNTLAASGVKEI